MSYESEVLVVGAGPTGLVAAITLAQRGINVVVVDAATSNNNGARAAVVHAHTLELLSSLGVADAIIERGIRCDRIRFSGDAKRSLIEVNMSLLKKDTLYPFGVLISQAHVEEVFQSVLESLKVEIHRGNGITGIKRLLEDKVEVMLSVDSIITTKYIIGADGAHSTIRHLVGIDFKDPSTGLSYDDANGTNVFQMALADVYMADVPAHIPRNEPTFHLDRNLMLIPLPSSEKNRLMWRIGVGSPTRAGEIPHSPPIKYFQEELNKRNPFDTPIIISSVLSSSQYRVRAALADTYTARIGKTHVLLVGDAAHVHSPVGGQGMNMGICDAVSAARTIVHHITSGDADRDLVFQTYTKKRREVGKRVVGMAMNMTKLLSFGAGSKWKKIVRTAFLRLVMSIPPLRKMITCRVSGLRNRSFASELSHTLVFSYPNIYIESNTICLERLPHMARVYLI